MAFPPSHDSALVFPPPHQTHQLLPDFQCLKRSISFSGTEEDDDGCPSAAGKKRRLSLQQVRALERSFEAGVKLEPDRKLQLAAALGLQPRQIAVWFQNRRARWKTKQLEKEYEQLKQQLQALKDENDELRVENQKFHARLLALRSREATNPAAAAAGAAAAGRLGKEGEDSWSFGTESNSEIVDVSRTPPEGGEDGFRPPTASEAGFRQPESERFAAAVQDEGLICSVIGGGMEDRLGVWLWEEQQHRHFD